MFPGLMVADATAPAYSDFSSILTQLQTAIPVSTIVAVIGGVLGITVTFAFAWWGARYGVKKLMASIKKGKATV